VELCNRDVARLDFFSQGAPGVVILCLVTQFLRLLGRQEFGFSAISTFFSC